MTHDEQTVERVAKAIYEGYEDGSMYSECAPNWNDFPDHHGPWIAAARAALSALPPQEVSVQEAAKVLRSEWEDHGEGLIGELSCYSPFDENGFFYMDADVDGEWVKFSDVKAALSALSEGKA